MNTLIKPEELPLWVPGDLTVDSATLGWDGLRLRGYRYAASDVPVPAMEDYMIVVYRSGSTAMNRRCGGPWQGETVGPGSVSLLTHAAPSHWRWNAPIEVNHVYLSPAAVAKTAADVYERDVDQVELLDVLKTEDPILASLASQLDRETTGRGVGSTLYIESLRNMVSVHVLRTYATVHFREPTVTGGLSAPQRRSVREFIEENIDRNIVLAELAEVAHLSVFHFSRKFQKDFGCPPHAYVRQRRLEAAGRRLAKSDMPLKAVAAHYGFADQSHMTRLFRRAYDMTPAEYRRATGRRDGDETAAMSQA